MKLLFRKKNNKPAIVLASIGAIAIIYSLIIAAYTNSYAGIAFLFCIGVFLIFLIPLFRFLEMKLSRQTVFALKLFTAALAFFIVVLLGIIILKSNTTTFDEDAVIVLGAGIRGENISLPLKYRLDKAIEYAEKNPSAIIVVSGGQGQGEDISEALAMKRYLVLNNVTESKIIMEDESTSTYENFTFSKVILDKEFSQPYKIVYITNNFHAYRAGVIANNAGFNATSFSAKTQLYLLPTSYLRELLAVVALWFLH